MADKVVRADRLAHFVIHTQLQSELPILWYGWESILQFFDFLDSFLNLLPQNRITHIGISVDWLEARHIST